MIRLQTSKTKYSVGARSFVHFLNKMEIKHFELKSLE